MGRTLTLEQLARTTGEAEDNLRQWHSLGLIGAGGGDGFGHEDLERVGLMQLFLRRGIGLETIVQSARDGHLSQRLDAYLDSRFPGAGRPAYSLAEAAAMNGMDVDLARRVWHAASLGRQDEPLNTDDLQLLSSCKFVLGAGLPEEALVQLARAWAEALGRAAEVTSRVFHFYVHEPMKAAERSETAAAANAQLTPLLEPAILYFLRRGMVWALPEDMAMHLAEEAGVREMGAVPGQLLVAVVFVDLSSFTPLAEAMGDLEAARVLQRFAGVVREAATRWRGQVVKQIGDAFMLAFREPQSAVACALDIEDGAASEPQFPAVQSGLHWGPVLYREGDYIGSNVNLAARVAAAAARHQVLVTAAVRKQAHGLANVEFVLQGTQRLKGVADDVELFAARRIGVASRERAVDPVCGMELRPAEIVARLGFGGTERAFCSQECLRRFVAAPERYGA